uniref:VWFA domain-containing protein n=1 Tax=Chromera velia CCMP2878 TaxID=1169474 RepID=A0A0G4FXR4_9ALVE|eukprot:Cvel_19267.t1-p1 / transcript=Cvel_19267.t1 / gene=Cvel_19267 / organism=Chromera_velia_CCMP2878 / gene_product=von Willebrand factor A domain-containing protein, putative / transcript_product=von Willebrand factor A domain-containing protein, putative / location=Cvel_scaffold1649:20550-26083(-) / protein_length=989 / sequence_SO=supercontig / SO=protein_coding / is_pseudo=false
MTPQLGGLFIVAPPGETITIYIGKDRTVPHVCRHGTPVPLQGVHLETKVIDMVAVSQLTQTYFNVEQQPIEARYCFPLLESSAVTAFRAEIEGRVVEAEAKEKVQAKQEYTDALRRGDGAYLLEQEGPDIFQCSIGNIPPRTCVKVTMTFVHELAIDEKSVRLLFPMHIAPRYCPAGVSEEEFFPSSAAMPYCPPPGFENDARLTFSASLEMTSAITRLLCTSHQNAMTGILSDSRKGHVKLGLSGGCFVGLERDVVVKAECADFHKPRCLVESSETDKGKDGTASPFGSVAVITMVPQFDLTELPCELIFLVDRSGSMRGKRIEQTRAALEIFVQSLPLNCIFNFVSFGSSHRTWRNGSVAYDEQSLTDARKHIKDMEANMGGTELGGALRFALERNNKAGFARQVFVLTDGQVTNTTEMIDLALRYRDKARVFTLGIGSGVSTELVAGLARAGGGDAKFVQDGEDVRQQVVGLLKRALQPALTDLEVDWTLTPEEEEAEGGEKKEKEKQGEAVEEGSEDEEEEEEKASGVMSFFNPNQKNKKNQKNRRKPPPAPPAEPLEVSEGKAESVHQAPFHCPSIHPGSHFTVYGFLPKGRSLLSAKLQAKYPEGRIAISLTPNPVSFTSTEEQDENTQNPPPPFAGALHKMAARMMLRDLEEGTSFLHPQPGAGQIPDLSDCVKKEAVMLGTHFGLASKWTSLIAVEKRGGAGGEESLREFPVFIGKDALTPQRVVPQLGAGSGGWGGKGYRHPIPGTQKMKKRESRGLASSMASGIGGAFRFFAAPASAAPTQGVDMISDSLGEDPAYYECGGGLEKSCEEEDDDGEVNLVTHCAVGRRGEFESRSAPPPPPSKEMTGESKKKDRKGGPSASKTIEREAKASSANDVNTIASLQSFDGHFDASDELLRLMALSREDLEKIVMGLGLSESEGATLLAILFLESKFGSQKAVWELFAGKASAWLSAQKGGTTALSALLEKAKADDAVVVVLSG